MGGDIDGASVASAVGRKSMRVFWVLLIGLSALVSITTDGFAHPGPVDQSGCHEGPEGYHCH